MREAVREGATACIGCGGVLPACLLLTWWRALQIQGTAACLGVDALDERAMQMTRFVAPVTMLATGGAGQVSIPS